RRLVAGLGVEAKEGLGVRGAQVEPPEPLAVVVALGDGEAVEGVGVYWGVYLGGPCLDGGGGCGGVGDSGVDLARGGVAVEAATDRGERLGGLAEGGEDV